MSNLTAWGDSSSVPYVVQLGTWTNWSRGRIMGATLTVSRTNGNYLLSFTAFFISLVSVRFWRILCFVLHSRLATPAPRDALHHQRQALLRNANSATSSSWALVRLAWAWRGATAGRRRLLARTLPLILTAALCAAAFTVAGGFSSQISTGIGNEVLVDGSHCAITYTQGFNSSASNLMTLYVADQQLTANNYAQQCYNANATDYTFDCASFVTPALPSTVDYNAPCPFAPEICRSNTSNIRLDTGYLDTTQHLGVNAPADERILFRSIFQCAPLVTEDYTEHVTTPDGTNYTRYYYGPPANSATAHNWTYETPALESVYSTYTQSDVDPFSGRGRNFILPSVIADFYHGRPYPGDADIDPIPELTRSDVDLALVFLVGNGVEYMERNHDPWYRGWVPGGQNWSTTTSWDDAASSQPAYNPEEAASPLGCIQQYQVCNADEDHCGPLRGFVGLQIESAPLFNLSEAAEQATAGFVADDNPAGQRYQWFTYIVGYGASNVGATVNLLGAASLASQHGMKGGWVGALPDDQWQRDVRHWWAIWLAALQAAFVNFAVGTNEEALQAYAIKPPSSSVKESFCNNQRILSTEYTSFSLFGLCFIYLLGAVIVVVSYSLGLLQECLVHCGRRRNKPAHKGGYVYARLEWAVTETLQLQRAAYQGLGTGEWRGYTDAVPTTEAGDLMGNLAHSYTETPAAISSPPATGTPASNGSHEWKQPPAPVVTQVPSLATTVTSSLPATPRRGSCSF